MPFQKPVQKSLSQHKIMRKLRSYEEKGLLMQYHSISPLPSLYSLFSPLSTLSSEQILKNMPMYSLLTNTGVYARWLTLGDQTFVVRALNQQST